MPKSADAFEPVELLALARYDLQRGDLEHALEKLKTLVSVKLPSPESFVLMARVYAQLGLLERARQYFEKYIELNPEATHETFELGMTYFDQRNDEEALKNWGRVLQLQPTHPPSLFFSTLALTRIGKAADARRQLDVLIKSAPPDNLYVERGRELLKSLNNEPAEPSRLKIPDGFKPYSGH